MKPEDHHNSGEDDGWLPLVAENGDALTRAQARNWALVLDSRSVPCCIRSGDDGWRLLVPARHAETARSELRQYEERNRNWPPSLPAVRTLAENTLPTLSILILLATFHNLTQLGFSLPEKGIVDLHQLGSAHAARIVQGEWWRAVTALTLHADLTHLLGNLAIGGVFIVLLCRELGSGLAWSLLLCSGMLGNLLNAWLQSPAHLSVGASTAVFGAVGILTATSMMRYRHRLQRRWFIPVAAGLALLAILGSEGKETDLGAHLFGFISGSLAGAAAEYLVAQRGRPGPLLNAVLAVISLLAVTASWWMAVTAGSG